MMGTMLGLAPTLLMSELPKTKQHGGAWVVGEAMRAIDEPVLHGTPWQRRAITTSHSLLYLFFHLGREPLRKTKTSPLVISYVFGAENRIGALDFSTFLSLSLSLSVSLHVYLSCLFFVFYFFFSRVAAVLATGWCRWINPFCSTSFYFLSFVLFFCKVFDINSLTCSFLYLFFFISSPLIVTVGLSIYYIDLIFSGRPVYTTMIGLWCGARVARVPPFFSMRLGLHIRFEFDASKAIATM